MIATQHSLVARLRENPCDSDWEKFYRLYEKPDTRCCRREGTKRSGLSGRFAGNHGADVPSWVRSLRSHPQIHSVSVWNCERLRVRRAQA